MKTIAFLFALLFMVNCVSYKKMISANPNPEKKHKIILNNKEKIIAKNLKLDNEHYTYIDNNNQQQSISKEMISEIRERKFSCVKSVALSVGTVTAFYFLGGIVLTDSDFLK